ncbi:tRNA lysidine(34) synthetase TilS [Candidatus Saccharibacteria bacterium]|nr:MAG: tRNA lysidine(34) synthetase TilS [Candidatus Saccharibacteria bacterium]
MSFTINLPVIPAGTYIVAVSGGVDSVVLLHLLQHQPQLQLVVAHFDHGIRSASSNDAQFVERLAKDLGLQFELGLGQLGAGASEETARVARYTFLHECRKKYHAAAIIAAHHQDDAIETMLINLVRGTGWRGLGSLYSHEQLLRPMLEATKDEIISYAKMHRLTWHEDETNSDSKILRNYIRHKVVPRIKMQPNKYGTLVDLYKEQLSLRQKIDPELKEQFERLVKGEGGEMQIDRYQLIMLPSEVSYELLHETMVRLVGSRLLQRHVERILLFAKTAKAGKTFVVSGKVVCRTTKSQLIVQLCET